MTNQPKSRSDNAPASIKRVAILNAGGNADYLYSLVTSIVEEDPGVLIDIVDGQMSMGLYDHFSQVRFLNLRCDQESSSPFIKKILRILVFYARLTIYACRSEATVFHIQWNNKFPFIDRVILTRFYRLLGKKLLYTAHNINSAARSKRDTRWNRWTLRLMYHSFEAIFVHSEEMADELSGDFGIPRSRIEVVNRGINRRVNPKGLSRREARRLIGVPDSSRVLLFFGNIRDYKGTDILLEAFESLHKEDNDYYLVIAGRLSDAPSRRYVPSAVQTLVDSNCCQAMLRFVAPEEVEPLFTAADCLVLPYRALFQSGVTFMAYAYGVPVIGTRVGSLPEDIEEGRTGSLCEPESPTALADAIRAYFASDLYDKALQSRMELVSYMRQRFSWKEMAQHTVRVYEKHGWPDTHTDCSGFSPHDSRAS